MTSYENPHHYIGGFGVAPRRQRRCGVCRETGHDRRRCALALAAVEETPPPYEEVAPPVYKPKQTYRQEQLQLFHEMWDATEHSEDGISMVEVDFSTPPLNSCGLETEDNDIVITFVVEPIHGWIFLYDEDGEDLDKENGIVGQLKSTDVDWDEQNALDDDDIDWWVDFDWQ